MINEIYLRMPTPLHTLFVKSIEMSSFGVQLYTELRFLNIHKGYIEDDHDCESLHLQPFINQPTSLSFTAWQISAMDLEI